MTAVKAATKSFIFEDFLSILYYLKNLRNDDFLLFTELEAVFMAKYRTGRHLALTQGSTNVIRLS
jgi:hypothetical protein